MSTEEGVGESASCMVCMATYLWLGGVLAYERVFVVGLEGGLETSMLFNVVGRQFVKGGQQ